VGKPSLNAAQPYAKAEGRVFLLVPTYPGCPGTKAVKRLLLLLLLLLYVLFLSFLCYLLLLFKLSLPVQLSVWKDSCPTWPVICQMEHVYLLLYSCSYNIPPVDNIWWLLIVWRLYRIFWELLCAVLCTTVVHGHSILILSQFLLMNLGY